jgi:hypothetical protein
MWLEEASVPRREEVGDGIGDGQEDIVEQTDGIEGAAKQEQYGKQFEDEVGGTGTENILDPVLATGQADQLVIVLEHNESYADYDHAIKKVEKDLHSFIIPLMVEMETAPRSVSGCRLDLAIGLEQLDCSVPITFGEFFERVIDAVEEVAEPGEVGTGFVRRAETVCRVVSQQM